MGGIQSGVQSPSDYSNDGSTSNVRSPPRSVNSSCAYLFVLFGSYTSYETPFICLFSLSLFNVFRELPSIGLKEKYFHCDLGSGLLTFTLWYFYNPLCIPSTYSNSVLGFYPYLYTRLGFFQSKQSCILT